MILSHDHNQVRVITLARPDRRNALTPAMLDELHGAVLAVTLAPGNARALVLAGQGPMFCAGFDLALCEADPTGSTMRRLLAGLSQTIRTLRALPFPVVLAAHGGAIAGGAALLAAADLTITDRAAKFGYPVHRLGVSPAVSAASLSDRIGPGATRRLQLEGPLIPAPEALALGWVHEIVDNPDHVLSRALDHAAAFTAKPPDALRATRAWLDEIESAASPTQNTRHDAGLATSLSLVTSLEERALLRVPAPARTGQPKSS